MGVITENIIIVLPTYSHINRYLSVKVKVTFLQLSYDRQAVFLASYPIK